MSKVIRIEDESFEYLKTLNNSPNNAIKVMKSKIEEKDSKIEKQIDKFEKEQKEIIQILRLLLKATFESANRSETYYRAYKKRNL